MKNVNAMLNQTFVNQQRFQERLAQLKTQHRPPQQRVVKSKFGEMVFERKSF